MLHPKYYGYFGAAFLGALMLSGAAHAATITVYAAGPRGLDRKLAAAFEKKSGDSVQLWAASTGKVLARLQAEQANPRADVVILADQSAGLALQAQGVVARYRPATLLKELRPALRLPSDFLSMGADTVAIVVNTRRLPHGQAPHDWKDLLGKAYHDQVSMPNPLLSGTAADFVLGFAEQHKDGGWPFFAALKHNGAIWPGPNAAALAPVTLGARSVLMAGVGHTALKAKKRGNSLALVLPSSGTLLIPRPIVILKSSKHMAAAKKFVDFVLSKAGQTLVSHALLLPAVQNVKPNPIWPNIVHVKFWHVDWSKMARVRVATLKRFDANVIR